MRRLLAVAVLVVLTACGGDSDVSLDATTTTERPNTVQEEAHRQAALNPTTTTTRALVTTTTRPADYPLGSTLTVTPGDHKITVYTYRSPVSSDNRFIQPKSGFVFASVDIQHCAGPTGDRLGPNRFDWELAMPDNTRLRPGSTVVEPQLGASPLGPNDCIRGWVSFEVPSGSTPRHVVYNEVTSGGAKWRVA